MKLSILFTILLLPNFSFAEARLKVLSAVKTAHFQLGVGSTVQIMDGAKGENLFGLFLGRMVSHPEFGDQILILDEKTEKILMVDGKGLKSSVAKTRMQPLISTIDQTGETCAAYGIYHYWQQSFQIALTPDRELERTFSHERFRMKLLEETITSYYLGRTYNLNVIMNKFGKKFAFKCREKKFKDSSAAVDFVFSKTMTSLPVLMEFNIGPSMVSAENFVADYESEIEMDPSLWIPRKRGEKNSGGHVVVGSAAFMHKGRKKVVVLDSNWNEPRVWDMESYLDKKTAIEEMNFHVCESATDL